MHILVIGRTLPTEKSSSLGLFEFEQARALAQHAQVGYLFLETESLLTTRKIKKINERYHDIPTIGYYFPIGRFLGGMYRHARYKFFLKAYQVYEEKYGKPDLIHVHFPTIVLTHDIIGFIERKAIKLFLTEHWSKVQEKKIARDQIEILKHARSVAKITICVSEELKNSVQELTADKSDEDLTVIPNMIADKFFQPYGRNNIAKEKFTFSFIGRLIETKRVDLLIDSFQQVFQNNETLKLNIIGDGPERKKLKNLVKKECEDQIIFWGNMVQDKVFEILTSTDVYVSASHYESFGVPFIEALAMGIPVIVSSNMPIIIYLDENKGVIFEDENKKDLSKKLQYMYDNIESYDPELVRSGIFEKFNRNHIAKKIMNLYMQIN